MTLTLSPERLSAPTPRYTSYPTAVQFSERVGAAESGAWIAGLSETAALSLYVHIPFCGALCWYCGCSTTVVNTPGPIAGYLEALESEMLTVADRLGARRRVVHLHWGGGSPNSLSPEQIEELAARQRQMFDVAEGAEFAVEIDPRFMDAAHAAALGRAGVNRVSIGVQDFSPEVQAAINRHQSFATTRKVVDQLRQSGIAALNIDLVYGLPHQTEARLADTLEQALALRPDRLAVFGYAHLPQRIRHQRLIPDETLPGHEARLNLAELATARLLEAGYVRVGLDHFARPEDPLARGPVHRNFQGYTTDPSDALIGFGASAISRLPQGYAQNAAGVADYRRRIATTGLATARGVALSDDDRMRAHVIERLMCDRRYSAAAVRARFGPLADALQPVVRGMDDLEAEGLIVRTSDGFHVPDEAAPYIRIVCARFDTWLAETPARHAPAV